MGRRIILNWAPVQTVWQLPVGIATLAAVLKNQGHDVVQRYGHILGLEYVLSQQDGERTRNVLATIRNPDSDILGLNQARLDLQSMSSGINNRFKDSDAIRFRVGGNNVLYVSHYYGGEYEDIDGVAEAIKHRGKTVFYDYFASVEIPMAQSYNPHIYGISIADERQIVPGLVLASMVKDQLPDCLVVLGGNIWPRVITPEFLQRFSPLFTHCCDAIVYAEGYQPLSELAETLDPKKCSGTVWRDDDGTLRMNPRASVPTSFETLPTPIFDGGARQWSPDNVYPLYTMSNCPKCCSFCAISAGSDTFLKRPRAMSVQRVVDHMVALGGHRFDLQDEDTSISRMLELGEELHRRGYPATWQCYAEVSKRLLNPDLCYQLYQAGTRAVQLGLETLSRDSLKRVDKAWNHPEVYGQILRNLTNAGIQVHGFIIIGIPGEAVSWNLRWLPFFEEYGDAILTLKPGRYRLTRGAPEERDSRHNSHIELLPQDYNLLHPNREFRYYEDGRSVRKDVEAMRDILEAMCRRHWAYEVTSAIPWWINRGRYTIEQLRSMAAQLSHDAAPPHYFDRALQRVASLLHSERGIDAKPKSYEDLLGLASTL